MRIAAGLCLFLVACAPKLTIKEFDEYKSSRDGRVNRQFDMILGQGERLLKLEKAGAKPSPYATLSKEDLIWLLEARDAGDSIAALTRRGTR